MKLFKLFVLSLLYSACTSDTNNNTFISILIDRTDSLSFQSEKIDIISLSGIDKNIWQSVHVEFSTISDIDINGVQSLSIPPENSLFGNEQMRNHKIEKFRKDIDKTLGVMAHVSQPLDHSIIYRTVATKLNALAQIKSENKHLLIVSDLMDNAKVNFYDPATFALILINPKKIETLLQKECGLENLSGIHVWLLYNPNGYDSNNIYMTVAMFYKHLLESKGAIVHIGNSVQ